MPEEGVEKLAHHDILSYEDIVRVCRCFAVLGIRKIKVTGGEPLVRENASQLIRVLKQLEGIEQVAMTTNGILLAKYASALRNAGLDGINISLDTLNPELYRHMTRWGMVDKVLKGIDAALTAGIPVVKVNCVPAGGINLQDILQVALLAKERDIHVRFIEMMPMGLGVGFDRIDNHRICNLLEAEFGMMTPWFGKLGNGPAIYGTFPAFRGKIGFISALGDCFCERCNRIRLTAEGIIRPCLHSEDGILLKTALKQKDDGLLMKYIQLAIWQKPERHGFLNEKRSGRKIMSQIGG